MYKKLNIEYNKQALQEIASDIEYSDGYKELGRVVPQEVHPAFDMNHKLVQDITRQFSLPKIFYSCSFIRTRAKSIVAPHSDSASNSIRRTVNVLFPLDNYNTPLNFYQEDKLIDSVVIDSPTAFDCSALHGYENNTDGWRSAFLLQCKHPYTFEKLISTGAI